MKKGTIHLKKIKKNKKNKKKSYSNNTLFRRDDESKNIFRKEISFCRSYDNPKKKYDIVVGRWHRDGSACCSRSCNICIEFMRSLCNENQVIDRVYYFDSNGVFGYEYLFEMESLNFSRGTTRFSMMCDG